MYHPSRGGVRGGTDQFTWDTVKTDKHRENYLGHSLMAPVGRWQKGKDLVWYSKDRQNKDSSSTQKKKSDEMSAVKKAEEEAMMVALGFKTAKKEQHTLNKEELNEVLRRGQEDRSTMDIERIQGVGVESSRAAMLLGSSNKSDKGITFEFRASEKLTGNHQASELEEKSSHLPKRISSTSSKCFKKRKKEKKDKKKKKYKHSSESENGDSDHEKRRDRRHKDISMHSKKHKKTHHRDYSSEREVDHREEDRPKLSWKKRDRHLDSDKDRYRKGKKCSVDSDSDERDRKKRRTLQEKSSKLSRKEKHSSKKSTRHDTSESE